MRLRLLPLLVLGPCCLAETRTGLDPDSAALLWQMLAAGGIGVLLNVPKALSWLGRRRR